MEARTRFWRKVKKGRGCWPWQAGLDQDGYGQFWLDGATRRAPRVAFFFAYGYWPKEVAHRCANPVCVRPSHLRDSTHAENILESDHHKRRVTACPKGHEYDAENTYIDKYGHRGCKECKRQSCRDWHARKRAA